MPDKVGVAVESMGGRLEFKGGKNGYLEMSDKVEVAVGI